jgi:hypothetical protein
MGSPVVCDASKNTVGSQGIAEVIIHRLIIFRRRFGFRRVDIPVDLLRFGDTAWCRHHRRKFVFGDEYGLLRLSFGMQNWL